MVVNRPPMGWNTWNTFGANINEELILKSTDVIVESGLKDAGYEYVVVDDVWSLKQRDENGRLVPDPEKFPHGMKYVSDYIHSKGLKFGMYSCAGYFTCEGYPGSFGHEWEDAKTFAEWGVDLLKYDYCFHPTTIYPDLLYKRMGLALRNCGRDILFSACSWGADNTKQWIKETGAHMWRSTGDIFDNWESVKKLIESQIVAQEYNGHGCFNDMDMLVVGMNGKGHVGLTGCTTEEYRLHYSLWALLNSPLMIGCDVRDMTDETKEILLNKEVIAINQDCYHQPFLANAQRWIPNEARKSSEPFYTEYPLKTPIIAKYLDNGDIAIGFFNLTDENIEERYMLVNYDNLGIPIAEGRILEVKDLWTGEIFKSDNDVIKITGELKAHECRLYRARFVEK